MPFYTYDSAADALYVVLGDNEDEDSGIARTIELGQRLHVDLDDSGEVFGVEILYPARHHTDLTPLRDKFGIDLDLPFTFAVA